MGNNYIVSNSEVHMGKNMNQPGVYSLTLRTIDGRAQSMIAYIPTENVLHHYINKAHKNGLHIEIKSIDECN